MTGARVCVCSIGTQQNQSLYPRVIAEYGGLLYVADAGHHHVVVYRLSDGSLESVLVVGDHVKHSSVVRRVFV